MNDVIIGKKVSHNGVEFLDFAVDDNDNLLTFKDFPAASAFLKKEIGENEELYSFLVTSIEAQQNNPRLQAVLNKASSNVATPTVTETPAVQQPTMPSSGFLGQTELVTITFDLNCTEFDLVGTEAILNKATGQTLVPVIAFVEPSNPQQPVPVNNLLLKSVAIKKV